MSNETRDRIWTGAVLGLCAVGAIGSWFSAGSRGEPSAGGAFEALGKLGSHELGVIDVNGVITQGGEGGGVLGGGGGASADALLKSLKKVAKDKPKGLLVRINSPGGSAAASQAIADEVGLLREKVKGIKIVACMGDVAASGGYFVASAADKIFATPATLTGSIGVIMHLQNYQGLMGKVGVQSVVIKSGKLKDIGSPDRPMTAEEHQLLQSIVDDTYGEFLRAVSKGRHMPVSKIRPLADGRIYTGRQAMKVKLVDAIGSYQDAERYLRKETHVAESVPLKTYGEEGWSDALKGFMSGATGVRPPGMRALFESGSFMKIPLALYE